MAVDGAIVGGAFALAGVAMQQGFTLISDRRRFERDRAREIWDRRISLYTGMIADARRVQRALRDSAVAAVEGASTTDDRLRQELEHLAQSVAAVRLLASPLTTELVESFEERAREVSQRPAIERSPRDERLQLAPVIRAIRSELTID